MIGYVVLTGGLVVTNTRNFGGMRQVQLTGEIGASFSLEPRHSGWGCPFVFIYYGATKPYGLYVQIWDRGCTFAELEISGIDVAYASGEVVHLHPKWRRQFKEWVTNDVSSPGGPFLRRDFTLWDTVDGIVTRHEDATVTVTGEITTQAGLTIPFVTTEEFVAESHFEISTFWRAMGAL